MRGWVLGAIGLCAGCLAEPFDPPPRELPPLEAIVDHEPVLRRLTAVQYTRALRDLFGEAFEPTVELEPDTRSGGLLAVGAGEAAPSRWGVEQYDLAAAAAAKWVSTDAGRRAALDPCAAEAPDRACFGSIAERLGRRAWRRRLTPEQITRLAAVGETAANAYGDRSQGLAHVIAAILESPYFLYRVEVGEPDPERPGHLRYTSDEMASRLSFLFLGSIPDEDLVARADRGELVTEAGVRAAALHLLEAPAARAAVRDLFADDLQLGRLSGMAKDPVVFRHARPELWDSAREETLRTIEDVVFAERDYRELFRSRVTFVDRRMASLYAIPAPGDDGFAQVELPAGEPRRGILGQAAFLAANAHPASSSATLRGKFIREVLLCRTLQPPPANVDTSLPEPDTKSPTLRQRIKVHQESDVCGRCHRVMDPIGLGLENFDGVGRFRATENDAPIDPSGVLDGVAFADAAELADAIADHPDLSACAVRTAYRYALGRFDGDADQELLLALERRFDADGRKLTHLLADIAASTAFRSAGLSP